MPDIRHVFTSPQADATGTVTIWNGATTSTVAASVIVRPTDWNASHAGGLDLAASNTTYTSGTVVLSGGANVTVGTNGQTVTISGHAAQTVQTQNMVALSASDALFSSGTVVLTGLGAATVNTAAGSIRVSVPVQSVQTQNVVDVSLSGNTAGALALVSSGTLTLAGGNNITLSQAGNAVTISGAAAGGAQTAISGIAASNTTYTSGSVTFTGVGGGVTVSSNTGQRVDISVAAPVAQTVQTQNLVAISASNNLFSSGTVTVSGFGAATVNTAAGLIRISVPTQTAQTGISGLSNSNTTYTSGTVGLSELGAITIRSTTGNQFQFSVNSQTVQTQGMINATVGGNSTSAGAGYILISSGTLTLAGGNNVTLSQNGNAVTISGAAAGGAQTAISGLANSETTYTSGSVTLSALGAITIRSTTGQHFQFSVNAQTAQTGISGISNSNTTYTSGTVGLSELGAITIRSTTGNQFQFSVNAQTAQTGISGISNSNTTYTSGTVGLSELGAITIRSTTGNQFQFSVNSQTTQTQGVLSAGVSTGGNTEGNTTANTGSRMVFVGSNMITLSQATAAGASTITIKATQSVQTQTLAATVGGNSTSAGAGYVLMSTGTMTLAGGNNITLSQNGNAVTISGAAGGGAGFSAGVSTGGNTAGATGVTGTRLVFVGSNDVSLSQTTDANGGTITIRDSPTNTMSYWNNVGANSGAGVATTNATAQTRSLYIFPLAPTGGGFLPGVITASTVRMLLSLSASTASITQSHSMGFSLGLYRISASNSQLTLSLMNSVASTWAKNTQSTTAATNSYAGIRWLEFVSSQWSVQPVFNTGEQYYMGFISSWSSISFNTGALYVGSHLTGIAGSGTMNAASAANTTRGFHPWHGVYSATTAALPASIHMSQIRKDQQAAQIIPFIALDALYSTH